MEPSDKGGDVITAGLWVTHWQFQIELMGAVETLAGGSQFEGYCNHLARDNWTAGGGSIGNEKEERERER